MLTVNYPNIKIYQSSGKAGTFLAMPANACQIKSLSISAGLSGIRAEFECVLEKKRDFMAGTMLKVTVDTKTVFLGFVMDDSFTWDAAKKTYSFSAIDVASTILSKVFVGQCGHTIAKIEPDNIVNYIDIEGPRHAIYPAYVKGFHSSDLIQTWTPKRIIENLYLWLPIEFQNLIRFGDVQALEYEDETDLTGKTAPLSFDFTNPTTVGDALQQVVKSYGDVQIIIRFDGVITYLDFLRVSKGGRTVQSINFPYNLNATQRLTNAISNISFSSSKTDFHDRVILHGRPEITCTTLSTFKSFDESFEYPEELVLLPAWEQIWFTVERNFFDKKKKVNYSWTEWVSNEAWTLEHGRSASDPTSEFYRRQCEKVFKNYKLPAVLTQNRLIEFSNDFYVSPTGADTEETVQKGFKKLTGQALIHAPKKISVSAAQRVRTLQASKMLFHAKGLLDTYMGAGFPLDPLLLPDDKEIVVESDNCYCYGLRYHTGTASPGWVTKGGPVETKTAEVSHVYDRAVLWQFQGETPFTNLEAGLEPMIWAVDPEATGTVWDYRMTAYGDGEIPTGFEKIKYEIVNDEIVLERPAVQEVYTNHFDGLTKTFSAEAPIFIPISWSDPTAPVTYDTGLIKDTVNGFDVISSTVGSVLVQKTDYVHIVQNGFILYCDEIDENIDSQSDMWQSAQPGYLFYAAGDWDKNSTVIKSDLAIMKKMGDSILEGEKNTNIKINFSQPFFSKLKVGDGLSLTGDTPQNLQNKKFFITSLNYNLSDELSTEVQAQTQLSETTTWEG